MDKCCTLESLRREAVELFIKNNVPDASVDAWYLMEDVFEIDRVRFLMNSSEPVTDTEKISTYRALAARRAQGEPVQYLTGKTEFMGLPFIVSEAVLIPRQDTEVLVETALGHLKPESKVLDMCTGSGCIILSIAALGKIDSGTGADISPEALEIAGKNRDALKQDKVRFVQTDLFSSIDEKYDMIVSNPPYIPTAVIPTLMREVRDHEPVLALDGTEDGLFFYRQLAKLSPSHLNPEGMLILEIGCDQADEVTGFLKEAGFKDIQVIKDLAGLDRVVYGRI